MKVRATPEQRDEAILQALRDGILAVSSTGAILVDGKPAKLRLSRPGYWIFDLPDRVGIRSGVFAHRVIALALLPEPNHATMEVNHIDGTKANNAPSNLEWLSKSENAKHAYRIGLSPRDRPSGFDHPGAKIPPAAAAEILSGDTPAKDLAEKYGVTERAIHLFCRRNGKPRGRKHYPTEIIRAAQESTEPCAVVAARLGVSERSVRGWRAKAIRPPV